MKSKVYRLQRDSFVAQAAHWFDWSRMWPEAARILRKHGSAAFWVCHTVLHYVILLTLTTDRFILNFAWRITLL
jgi:hypothetical protein